MLPKGSISKIYEYYFTAPRYKEEVLRALREFFDQPDLGKGGSLETDETSEGLFNEWFLYDFVLSSGRIVLEDFISTNPFKLEDLEMKSYRDLLDSCYGMFEVLEVKLGQGIKIEDMQTGKQWVVSEFNGTFNLGKGFIFFGRVGKVGDHYELVGADSFSLEGVNAAAKKAFRKEKFKLL